MEQQPLRPGLVAAVDLLAQLEADSVGTQLRDIAASVAERGAAGWKDWHDADQAAGLIVAEHVCRILRDPSHESAVSRLNGLATMADRYAGGAA